jgi:glycine cleavage system H protein
MLKYTKEHEWIRVDGAVAFVGITEYASQSLGTLVYIELPKVGKKVNINDACAVVEAAKSASDVYSPISGEIIEVNSELESSPEKVNEGKDGECWLFKISVDKPSELEDLLTYDAYKKILDEHH